MSKYHPVEWCEHVFESDCHGIEMIKDPDGKEWAIGGTDTTGRWLFDPWCGKRTPPVKKSLEEVVAEVIWLTNHPKTPFAEVDPIFKTIWLSEAKAAIAAMKSYRGEK